MSITNERRVITSHQQLYLVYGTSSNNKSLPIAERVHFRRMANAIQTSFELLKNQKFLNTFEPLLLLSEEEIAAITDRATQAEIRDIVCYARDPSHCYFYVAAVLLERM